MASKALPVNPTTPSQTASPTWLPYGGPAPATWVSSALLGPTRNSFTLQPGWPSLFLATHAAFTLHAPRYLPFICSIIKHLEQHLYTVSS